MRYNSIIEMVSKKRDINIQIIENDNFISKPSTLVCGICCFISQLYCLDCGHVLCKDCGIKVNDVCPYCKRIFSHLKKIYFA